MVYERQLERFKQLKELSEYYTEHYHKYEAFLKLALDLKINPESLMRILEGAQGIDPQLSDKIRYLWNIKIGEVYVPISRKWIRKVMFDIRFQCCYDGKVMLQKPAEYVNVLLVTYYDTKPVDEVREWAERVSYNFARNRTDYACKELQTNFEGCNVEVFNMKYKEVVE